MNFLYFKEEKKIHVKFRDKKNFSQKKFNRIGSFLLINLLIIPSLISFYKNK